jgi:predicted O-methyltransferase YrrM
MLKFKEILDHYLPYNQSLYDVALSNKSHYEGGAGPDKKLLIQAMIYSLDAKLVCETGINGCGMAAAICSVLQETQGKYIGFELEESIKPVSQKLQELFPGTPEFIWGDSKKTLTEWVANNSNTVDLFFVDGDHTKEGLQIDLKNAITATKNNGIIVVDDVDTLRPYVAEIIPANECMWFQGSRFNGPGSCFWQVKK